ncbi:helix-turn-helix domain-containing protein [Paenibacillus oceani]|uniref:Helix-turn-helix transcriptional regulator n=1 Tax=Paenibacillus oceani TaxID=2772510 RepID=A0A927C7U5_9BACL|nr:helix-turn-helix domain-containing protein [Paenibacillus oceani]MBD2861637.1 helix-turn-helix transcriptional regulator [Paenibacillus oceani]
MYEKFEQLLKEQNVTPYRVAKETGITTATFTSWKQGKYTPKQDKLQKIADYFGKPLDYFTGGLTAVAEPADPYALTAKDERDIARDLERMMSELESKEALSFYGEEVEFDEEAKELLRMSMEQTMRLAKQLAKKKFTPKKYRKE